MKKRWEAEVAVPLKGIRVYTGVRGLVITAHSEESANDAAQQIHQFVARLQKEARS